MKKIVLSMAVLVLGCGQEAAPYRLVVEQNSIFCRPGTHGIGLRSTRAQKLRATIPAGEYELPATHAPDTWMLDAVPHSPPHDWLLPVELEFEAEDIEDAGLRDGTLWVEMNEALSSTADRAFFFVNQPVLGPDGRTGSFNLEQVEDTPGSRTFVLGPHYNPETLGVALWWDEPPNAFMASCDFDFLLQGLRYIWRIEHELGVIDLEFAGGYWRWPLSPPIVFDRASGVLAGVRFEQEDYFKLVHHAESLDAAWNSFAVLFNEPIAGACGIAFFNLGPEHPEAPRSAALVDCDLEEIQPLEILDAILLEPDGPSSSER